MSRHKLLIRVVAAVVLAGCDRPAPPPAETKEQTAARVLATARELEKGHETKRAFAAYRQISEQFPSTPEAKEAAKRIREARRQRPRKNHG